MDWQGWLDVAVSYLPPLPAIPQPPWWLSWLAGGASISTNILLRKLRIAGWYVMLGNQFCWGWLALAAGQNGLIVSTLFYVYLGLAGLVAWTKDPPVRTSKANASNASNERNEKTSDAGNQDSCCVHTCGGRGSSQSAYLPEEDTGDSQHDKQPGVVLRG